METEVKAKEKKVIGPVLGFFVFLIIGFVSYQLIGASIGQIIDALSNTDYFSSICAIIASLVYLIIYRLANKKTFDGFVKTDYMFMGFLFLMPWILSAFIDAINCFAIEHHAFRLTASTFLTAAYAGICEEITYRAVPVAHMMRCYNDGKKLIFICILSSVFFGLSHIANIFAGADVLLTSVQVVHSFSVGMLLCAVYLRTGSILPGIICHFVYDLICLMDYDIYLGDAVLTDASTFNTFEYVLNICFIIVAITLSIVILRKEKREVVLNVWAKKWHKNEA